MGKFGINQMVAGWFDTLPSDWLIARTRTDSRERDCVIRQIILACYNCDDLNLYFSVTCPESFALDDWCYHLFAGEQSKCRGRRQVVSDRDVCSRRPDPTSVERQSAGPATV